MCNFRKKIEHRVSENKTAELCVYYDGETVSGAVSVKLKPGAKLEHKGIKMELIGQIGKQILLSHVLTLSL